MNDSSKMTILYNNIHKNTYMNGRDGGYERYYYRSCCEF